MGSGLAPYRGSIPIDIGLRDEWMISPGAPDLPCQASEFVAHSTGCIRVPVLGPGSRQAGGSGSPLDSGTEESFGQTTTLLLARLHDSRDEEAWKLFDSRFRGVVLSAALRLGLSQSDAEDAAQDTMYQSIRDYQAGKYDRSRGRLSSWIIAIAHHRIIDIQRRKKHAMRGGDEVDQGTPLGSLESVTRAFEQALERRIFEQAWEHVREKDGASTSTIRAFELTALRGVPPSQAALECNMSVDQVYVARNRIATKLRETVEKIDRVVREGL